MSRTCPQCGAPVLRGLDSDTAGIPITLDAAPVDNLGEALALLAGRRTYDVHTTRDGLNVRRVFEQRTGSSIRTSSRLARRVHPEHRCGQPLPAAAPISDDWNQEPPF